MFVSHYDGMLGTAEEAKKEKEEIEMRDLTRYESWLDIVHSYAKLTGEGGGLSWCDTEHKGISYCYAESRLYLVRDKTGEDYNSEEKGNDRLPPIVVCVHASSPSDAVEKYLKIKHGKTEMSRSENEDM